MRRNVAAGIGYNEQGEYCRAALQRSDRKEPRYKWPTFTLQERFKAYFPGQWPTQKRITNTTKWNSNWNEKNEFRI